MRRISVNDHFVNTFKLISIKRTFFHSLTPPNIPKLTSKVYVLLFCPLLYLRHSPAAPNNSIVYIVLLCDKYCPSCYPFSVVLDAERLCYRPFSSTFSASILEMYLKGIFDKIPSILLTISNKSFVGRWHSPTSQYPHSKLPHPLRIHSPQLLQRHLHIFILAE